MTLDEIKSQWEKDCEIDDIELDKSSLEIPKLHAKYQDLLTSKILVMKQYQFKYDTLLKNKWLWYNGKMSEDQIKELGWNDDPLDGLKIMKNDLQLFYLISGNSSTGSLCTDNKPKVTAARVTIATETGLRMMFLRNASMSEGAYFPSAELGFGDFIGSGDFFASVCNGSTVNSSTSTGMLR